MIIGRMICVAANDLSLSYVAYLNAEQMVGSKINGSWRGMVGDVERGSADMAAGATSITPERMEVRGDSS